MTHRDTALFYAQAYGLRQFQAGLKLGLKTARSFLSSIENENARESCKNQLILELRKAELPEELEFKVESDYDA